MEESVEAGEPHVRAWEGELEQALPQARQVEGVDGGDRVEEERHDVLLADEHVEGAQQQQPAHLLVLRVRVRVRVTVGGLGRSLRLGFRLGLG